MQIRRTNPRARVLEATVEKVQRPDKTRLEAATTRAAAEVARRTGAFRVPEVQRHDDDTGLLVLERIHDLVPLRTALRTMDDPAGLMAKVGEALAAVHRHLALPAELAAPVPVAWRDEAAPQAFLHGDFNTTNVQVIAGTREIVILDWAFTDVWEGTGTYGPACFDAMWMAHTMMFGSILRLRPIPAVERMAARFLDSYLHAYGKDSPAEVEVMRGYLRRAEGLLRANHRARKNVVRSQVDRVRFARFARFAAGYQIGPLPAAG
ncbi:MAG TPA: phosphotransferase [Longimicrobiaceae bacterium]|nr:phosphotransferase [Longimicrobiaceae bacterium]